MRIIALEPKHKLDFCELVDELTELVQDFDDIYVRKEFQGKGIGKILLEKVEEISKKMGCENVLIRHVACKNLSAQKFYEKVGYKTWMLDYHKKLA